jgi:quinohemoprotein ethanol dehydrogenase
MRLFFLCVFSSLCLLAVSSHAEVDGAAIAASDQQGDWRAYGRSYSEQRFSPLKQINHKNVDQLKLDWYLDMPDAKALNATPLVVDGVMYFTASQSVVMAVDARNGAQLWRYDPQVLKQLTDKKPMRFNWGSNRGVAFWKGNVYVATFDGRLIALDAATGKPAWSVQTFPVGEPRYITGAPRAFKDMVIIGHGGAEAGAVRGYVTAYDAATGKQKWRTYTVPGNPANGFESDAMKMAATTWRGDWWIHGGGGTVWNSITYDPEFNRVYLGTGNGAPWNQEIRSPGGGDNLFLCGILALDADTGEYAWHYQTTPGENWDYNSAMDIVTAEMDWQGKPRKVILHAPKNGFFYVLDREDGKLLGAEKFGKVTWAERVDLKTGRPVETPEARIPNGVEAVFPSYLGAHNWQPMSYNPETGLVYIPAQEMAGEYDKREIDRERWRAKDFTFNTGFQPYRADIGVDDATGSLLAWDVRRQKPAWKIDLPGFFNGGTLTSAGNLVIQGTSGGRLHAYSADKGLPLWNFNAGVGISAPPISYAIDGKQYIAVLAGWGGAAYVGSTAFAQHGWAYGSQPRRLLTFSLDGKMKPPPIQPPQLELAIIDDRAQDIDSAQATVGQDLYLAMCLGCHGFAVISAGGAPDLRASTVAANLDSFRQLLKTGALQSQGMPRYQELNNREVEQMYWFIRQRARESLAEQKAESAPPP